VGKLLTTIDGVGPLTAACLIAELGDPARFRSAGAIASYVGVACLWRIAESWQRTLQQRNLVNPSLTVKVRFHARTIHLDRPSAGDPGKAWHPGAVLARWRQNHWRSNTSCSS
jgi:transposase